MEIAPNPERLDFETNINSINHTEEGRKEGRVTLAHPPSSISNRPQQ